MVSVSRRVKSTGKTVITVSPLHMNLKAVDFQRAEYVFTCPIMDVSWHVWCTLSHMCASSTSNCAFVYFTVQCCESIVFISRQDAQKQALKQLQWSCCRTTQASLDRFFKTVDRTESTKEPEPVPSTSSGVILPVALVFCCWWSFSSTISDLLPSSPFQ